MPTAARLLALFSPALLCLNLAQAQIPTPIPPTPLPAAPHTRALRLPGETQPIAPGTRRAPPVPELTLTPPMPQVRQIQYLGNGHIEVASAVLLLLPGEVAQARKLAATAAARTLLARPSLAEVDISVYNKAGYGGFGGPLPILTLSAPRARLQDVAAWAAGGPYERAWEALGSTPPNPGNTDRIADKVRERTINFFGDVNQTLSDAHTRTASRVKGGIQDGLLYGGNVLRPVAALTFDDAPHPMYEPLLLDLLRRDQIRATFFVIGRNARAYPYFVRDMVQQGHEVGNHTYHHVRLPALPLPAAITELSLTNQTLRGLTGQPVKYFRPPGGDYTPQTLDAARALGLTTVFWTDDPADFQNPGDGVLESRFDRRLHPGGIILLHDNAQETLAVFGAFLAYARKRGVTLTTVSGLLGGKPADVIGAFHQVSVDKSVPGH
ncbi:polysaccharide deacetylase family protein [Deinococcus alpinitundrae]|uniref:polysaccharide deacetylase family protein n=1 Tax=Deinococcus alpinitundrae TaxID=468913 RepID=UPI00137B6AE4|nr:polysaccharide deacetylase family protein [Deinococcus alpinitundrae]